MDNQQRLIKVVADRLGKEESEVKLESRFKEDLGADSLEVVELIMELEDEFDVEISDEEAEKMITVQDAVDYIQKVA